jgi:hypothetical protein
MKESDASSNIRKILASSLLDEWIDQVESIFAKELAALREALRAERTILGRDGEPLGFGPDHASRLAAGKTLVQLWLGNRRPSSKPPEEREPGWTLEEFKELVAAAAAKRMTPDGPAPQPSPQEMKKKKRRTP